MQDDFSPDIGQDRRLLPGTALLPGSGRLGDLPPAQLLLTGATGFIGVHIVDQLLQRTDAIIHCLVRTDDRARGLARLAAAMESYGLDHSRLAGRAIIVPGDLRAARCGLSGAAWDGLAEDIDLIIHNGAQLNFGQPYESLRPANVDGTRWLLQLAAAAGCSFTYVSTIMAVITRGDTFVPERVLETDPPPPFENLEGGYPQSKWVAERLVESAAAAGLPCRILRVGPVIGDARTGMTAVEQVQQRLAAASTALGIIPALRGPMDMVPVEYIAQAIVGLTLALSRAEGVFHLVNPKPIRDPELQVAIDSLGKDLRIVPFEEWLAAIRADVASNIAHPLRSLIDQHEMSTGIRELEYRLPEFDCARTTDVLAALGTTCPEPDATMVARLLSIPL